MKQAPSNLSAEAALLGAILYDNANYPRVAQHVQSPEDFFAGPHQRCYALIQQLINAGRVADGVTLVDHLTEDDVLTPALLGEIFDSAAFGPEVVDYAKSVADAAAMRRIIELGARLQKPGDASVDDLLNESETALSRLRDNRSGRIQWQSAGEAVEEEMDVLADVVANGHARGTSTGLGKLDDFLGGLHRGDLVAIGGASSIGKTALGVNIAFGAARTDGAKVALFSQEMSKAQLSWRVASSQARRSGLGSVAYESVRNGKIGQHELAVLREARTKLPSSIVWNCTSGLTLADVQASSRQAKKQLGGLDVILIDYLQIMDIPTPRGSSRTIEIGRVTAGLKQLAKDLDVTVVILCQIKSVDDRDNKKPRMSDFRESGNIHQDADVCMFVYRDEYYLKQSEPPWEKKELHAEWWSKMQTAQGKLDVLVRKQRMGPTGDVQLYFEPEHDLILDDIKQRDDEEALV